MSSVFAILLLVQLVSTVRNIRIENANVEYQRSVPSIQSPKQQSQTGSARGSSSGSARGSYSGSARGYDSRRRARAAASPGREGTVSLCQEEATALCNNARIHQKTAVCQAALQEIPLLCPSLDKLVQKHGEEAMRGVLKLILNWCFTGPDKRKEFCINDLPSLTKPLRVRGLDLQSTSLVFLRQHQYVSSFLEDALAPYLIANPIGIEGLALNLDFTLSTLLGYPQIDFSRKPKGKRDKLKYRILCRSPRLMRWSGTEAEELKKSYLRGKALIFVKNFGDLLQAAWTDAITNGTEARVTDPGSGVEIIVDVARDLDLVWKEYPQLAKLAKTWFGAWTMPYITPARFAERCGLSGGMTHPPKESKDALASRASITPHTLAPLPVELSKGDCLCCTEDMTNQSWSDNEEVWFMNCLTIGLGTMKKDNCTKVCAQQVHSNSYTQRRYTWSMMSNGDHCFGLNTRAAEIGGAFNKVLKTLGSKAPCEVDESYNISSEGQRAILTAIEKESNCPSLDILPAIAQPGDCLCCTEEAIRKNDQRNAILNHCLHGYSSDVQPPVLDATGCAEWCRTKSALCKSSKRKKHSDSVYIPDTIRLNYGSWLGPLGTDPNAGEIKDAGDAVFVKAMEKAATLVQEFNRKEGTTSRRRKKTESSEPPRSPLGAECATHAVDVLSKDEDDVCHMRVYKCANFEVLDPTDHNAGDVAWGLSKSCRAYGKYLHVFQIKVCKSLFSSSTIYTQCNGGPLGRHCGCGLDGSKCGEDPEKKKRSANSFGFRAVAPEYYSTPYFKWMKNETGAAEDEDVAKNCPCYEFALPSRAKAKKSLDVKRSKLFIQAKNNHHKHIDAPFQWKFAKLERVVDIDKCFPKHVWKSSEESLENMIRSFQKKVLDRRGLESRFKNYWNPCDNVTPPPLIVPTPVPPPTQAPTQSLTEAPVAFMSGALGSATCPSNSVPISTESLCVEATAKLGIEYNGITSPSKEARLPHCWLGGKGKANFNPQADFGSNIGNSKVICREAI